VKIRLLEIAKEDLREGWKFYEKQSAGLGDYFLDSIQADIRSLEIYAGVHAQADNLHRLLAKRFPFAIYYLLAGESIDVDAILVADVTRAGSSNAWIRPEPTQKLIKTCDPRFRWGASRRCAHMSGSREKTVQQTV